MLLDIDTFIFGGQPDKRVDLLDVDRNVCTFRSPYGSGGRLMVSAYENAPFACIKPCMGVATAWIIRVSIKTDWVWHLNRGEVFDASYDRDKGLGSFVDIVVADDADIIS